MPEYIDREAALAKIQPDDPNDERGAVTIATAKRLVRYILTNTPAADVAEVVLCKDCDAWKRNVGIVDSPNGHCFEHDIDTNGQDFCSYGEAREK